MYILWLCCLKVQVKKNALFLPYPFAFVYKKAYLSTAAVSHFIKAIWRNFHYTFNKRILFEYGSALTLFILYRGSEMWMMGMDTALYVIVVPFFVFGFFDLFLKLMGAWAFPSQVSRWEHPPRAGAALVQAWCPPRGFSWAWGPLLLLLPPTPPPKNKKAAQRRASPCPRVGERHGGSLGGWAPAWGQSHSGKPAVGSVPGAKGTSSLERHGAEAAHPSLRSTPPCAAAGFGKRGEFPGNLQVSPSPSQPQHWIVAGNATKAVGGHTGEVLGAAGDAWGVLQSPPEFIQRWVSLWMSVPAFKF